MKKILYAALAAMLLVGCQKSEFEGDGLAGDRLPIRFSFDLATRATDASYENGDKVGIFVSYDNTLAPTKNYVDNNEYTLENSKWTTTKEIFWKDKTTPADFYCYYPYGAVGDATAHTFAVKNDQSLVENYKASDFLWGSKADVKPLAESVVLSSKHILSNVLIYLKPGEGFTASEFAAAKKTLQIGNLQNNALINLADGTVTATGDKGTLTPYWNGEAYRAVVVPQTVDTSNNLVILTIDGVTYYMSMKMTFAPRTQHKMNVTVNKSSSGLNISIEAWEVDGVEHDGIAM